MTNQYNVYLLNSDMDPVAEIDQFKKLEIVRRFNDIGEIIIELTPGVFDTSLFDWRGGWRVLRNGVLFSEGIWHASADDDIDTEDGSLTFYGSDYGIHLMKRIVLAVPSGPPYTSSTHDVRTGPAGDVMKDYVRYHLSTSARTDRQISGFTVASNLGDGLTITQRARFPTLLETLQDVALKGGDLGFRFSGSQFETFTPIDKTGDVKFSRDFGNLISYKRNIERPIANAITAGGGGEGTSRTFVDLTDSPSVNEFGRIEEFYDYRNAGTSAELYSATVARLEKNASKVSIEIQVRDTEGVMFVRDYDLGDSVTVSLPNLLYSNIVREVRVTVTTEGERVYPVIGTPGARALQLLNKQFVGQRTLQERMSLLERI